MASNFSEDLTELCRFCAQSECKNNLLHLTENEEELKKCMIILEFLNIQYVNLSSEDNLPKTICNSCFTSLTNAYDFFQKVLQSQESFIKVIKIEDTLISEPISLPEVKTDSESDTEVRKTPNNDPDIIRRIKSKYKTRVRCKITNNSDSEGEDELVYGGVNVYNDISTNQDNSTHHIVTSEGSESDCDSESVDFKYAGYSMYNDHEKAWAFYTWQCAHCPDRLDTLSILRSHNIQTHNICFSVKCDECETKFKQFNEFIEHIRHHRDNLRYYCKYCDLYSETVEECVRHEKTHIDLFHACCSCGELFKEASSLARHERKLLSNNDSKNIDTSDSDDSLSSVNFDEEIEEEGTKIPPPDYPIKTWADYPWICVICRLAFLSMDKWRRHSKTKHGKCATYKCFDCKKYRCRKLSHLLGHIRQHRPNLRVQCHFCYEVKNNSNALRKHIAGHRHNYYWCDYCGEKFTEENSLETHLKKYRQKTIKKPKTPITTEDLTCKICGKICNSKNSLTSHKATHGGRDYACELCGQLFTTKTSLSTHLLGHDKQFICDICNRAFASRTYIIRHIDTHFDKKFTCEECGHKCRTAYALKTHKIKHSKLLLFECKICKKGFKSSLYLRRHSMQHTGEKPYLCKFCHKTFTNNSNCHKHMKRIHQTT